MAKHLSDFQIQECLCGDCSALTGWFRRRHIRGCPECARRAEAIQKDLAEQREFGAELKAYQEVAKTAEATMTMPKPPATS